MAIIYPDIDSIGWGDDVNDNFRELSQNDTDIKTTIGTETMGTTATTLKGAIKEHTTQLNANTQDLTSHKSALVTDSNGIHGLEIETGTFTPILYGASGAGTNTYSRQQGQYYKIGKFVHVELEIKLSALDSSMSGTIRIGGLPFVVSSTNLNGSGASIGFYQGITFNPAYTQLTAIGVVGQASLSLQQCGSGTSMSGVLPTNLTDTSNIQLSLSYQTI